METVFETKEQYFEMKKAWSEYVNGGEDRVHIEPYQLALYAILKRKDWRQCFSKSSKYETIDHVEYMINHSKYVNLDCFGGTIDDGHLEQLRVNGIPKWEW